MRVFRRCCDRRSRWGWAPGLEVAGDGDPDRDEGGLGNPCIAEGVRAAVKHGLQEILAQDSGRFVEGLAAFRGAFIEVAPHAGRLRPLAGKEEPAHLAGSTSAGGGAL